MVDVNGYLTVQVLHDVMDSLIADGAGDQMVNVYLLDEDVEPVAENSLRHVVIVSPTVDGDIGIGVYDNVGDDMAFVAEVELDAIENKEVAKDFDDSLSGIAKEITELLQGFANPQPQLPEVAEEFEAAFVAAGGAETVKGLIIGYKLIADEFRAKGDNDRARVYDLVVVDLEGVKGV